MSDVSQTRPSTLAADTRQIAVGMAVVGAVLALALGPRLERIGAVVARARPHVPDFDLVARLPVAIQVHLACALAALALGAALMAARKGRGFHRAAGWVWVSLVATTAVSSLFITSLAHGRWSLIHLMTGWTLIALPLGVIWARRHQVARHRRTMMGLFYGGFAINLFIAMIPGRTLWNIVFG